MKIKKMTFIFYDGNKGTTCCGQWKSDKTYDLEEAFEDFVQHHVKAGRFEMRDDFPNIHEYQLIGTIEGLHRWMKETPDRRES